MGRHHSASSRGCGARHVAGAYSRIASTASVSPHGTPRPTEGYICHRTTTNSDFLQHRHSRRRPRGSHTFGLPSAADERLCRVWKFEEQKTEKTHFTVTDLQDAHGAILKSSGQKAEETCIENGDVFAVECGRWASARLRRRQLDIAGVLLSEGGRTLADAAIRSG